MPVRPVGLPRCCQRCAPVNRRAQRLLSLASDDNATPTNCPARGPRRLPVRRYGTCFFLAITRPYIHHDGFVIIRWVMLVVFAPIVLKYVIQLIATPLAALSDKRKRKLVDPEHQPLVSVIVPAWNEQVGIVKTVASVLQTDYQNFEIIVINDGSTDDTDAEMLQFLASHEGTPGPRAPITYLRIANGGKGRALNHGIATARGEIVVTIDADSVMDREAIWNIVQRFSDASVGAVAGNVIVGNSSSNVAFIQQLEYLYGFFFKRADSLFGSVYIVGGAAAAYRMDVIREVGGFDPEIVTEDIEMSTRILRHGYRSCYAPDAVVYTEAPSSWRDLCKQRLRWKFGRLLTFARHRSLFFNVAGRQSRYLTCILLPVALYAETLLLFESVLMSVFVTYTVVTSDYVPLAVVIGLLTVLVALQVSFDPKTRYHCNLYLLAPGAWVLLLVVDVVEFQALCRSLRRLATGGSVNWQALKRKGLPQVAVAAVEADDRAPDPRP